MNKLVSKNSVQRFKQGKNIRKMQSASGGPLWKAHKENYVPYTSDLEGNSYFGIWRNPVTEVEGGSSLIINDAATRYDMRYVGSSPFVVPFDSERSYFTTGTKPNVSNTSSPKNTDYNQSKARNLKVQNKNSFNESFKEARNKGLKEFIWNGRRYNTQIASEKGYIWSDQYKKWINPKIQFVVPPITEPTQEELDELNRKAKLRTDLQDAIFAKKGSKLISRNSIEQFKRNFIQVDQ